MKKDLKYIIKKIIIGVGIATGIMFVKSLPVFAEEKNINAYLKYGSYESDRRFYIQSDEITTDIKIFDKIKVFDNTNFSLNVKTSDTSSYNEKNIKLVLLDKTNNVYYFLVLKTYIFANNGSIKDSYKKLNLSFSNSDMSYSMLNNDNSISGSITFPLAVSKTALPYNNSYNIEENLNNETYYFNIPKSNSNDYMGRILGSYTDFSNFVICYKSDHFPTTEQIFINNIQIEDNTGSSIPTGYEKIDMFNNYAILFYPKDFRNLPIECTKSKDGVITDDDGNVTVIPNKICLEESYKFTFYYSGYFNTAFTDLSVMDVVKNPVEQLTFPPTATPYELPLLRNINDFKGGIMFYNNSLSQITDKDGNVTTYYDKGYIYYDSSLFNYVIIEDYDTTPNQNISWVDKDGNTQNATINNIPNKNQTTLNKAQDTFDLFKNFKTNDHGLSSIITSPLSFIKNLSSATCTPVVLPIPFSKNQNVKLPCLTTMYEEKASSVYNIYKIVITGITAYWVCVRIYALVKGFKDPNDDKIEVMEL